MLDGEGFLQSALEEAMRTMPEYEGERYDSELDLFVTGTEFYGRVLQAGDGLGQEFSVKDHRAVFVLSYRGDRKNEFAPANVPALSKLARITSCFPVAFAPVHLGKRSETDRLLRRWGRLERQAYFIDGGVLDNKPFSFVIDAISRRVSERDADRLLLYIEPDPERFSGSEPDAPPSTLHTAANALSRIPRYRSISRDVETIAGHNRKVANWKTLRETLGTVCTRPGRPQWRMYLCSRRLQPCGDVNFRRRRLAHTIAEATSRLSQNAGYGEIADALRRQIQILEMVDFSLATERTQWVPLPVSGRPVGGLLNQSDRQERAILRKLPPGDPVREEYRRFIFLDAHLFPADQLAVLSAKDFIRTIRISPPNPEKVHGRKFGHFAAFLSSAWRAHDLLQGRLDATSQLIECLLIPARERGEIFSASWIASLTQIAQRQILAEELANSPPPAFPPARFQRLTIARRAALAFTKMLWANVLGCRRHQAGFRAARSHKAEDDLAHRL